MTISYITTDLEFDSETNLSPIVEELGPDVIVHLNDWVDNIYRIVLGLAHTDTTVDEAVCFYCSLVEKLSVASMSLWSGCTRRVLDIAFESGAEPECQTYQLPEALVKRVSALGLGITITIYRVGAYSDPSGE
jgi:hypothetical protein